MPTFPRVDLPRIVIRVDPPRDGDPQIVVRGAFVVDDTEQAREIGIPAFDRQPYRVLADVQTRIMELGNELVTQAYTANQKPPAPGLDDRTAALLVKAAEARQRVIARFAVCTCAYPYVRARTVSGHHVACPAHEVHLRDLGDPVLA